MPGFFREHLRPLVGAAGLHLLLFAIIVVTAWQWSSSRPPVPLALEGVVVDEHSLPQPIAAPPPKPAAPRPATADPVQSIPVPPTLPPDDAKEREADAQAARERAAGETAALEERKARDAERARQKQVAEEAARKQAEARRTSAEEEARRKSADEEARRKAAETESRRKAAAEQQARDAELKQQIAAEEAAATALARSGVVDQYRAELEQAIERSWIRPPSAQPGLECTLNVTQAPGGTVLDVQLGACNGDAAVRESITNAVFRASPLPAPADPRAFERRLEIVFRPTE